MQWCRRVCAKHDSFSDDHVLIFVVCVSVAWLVLESLVGGAVMKWIGSSANGLAEAQGCVVCAKHGVCAKMRLCACLC
jgi:hypothetical protein